ncbi:hypothetical protein [Lewinella sp.]|uniref:hypothetical protein n=1 Tax=Lewinella sp. TaxID=2004506 RepID=UPI003D6BC0E7
MLGMDDGLFEMEVFKDDVNADPFAEDYKREILEVEKITKEQAEILSRITKRSLVATPRKYDNYVLVERKGKAFIVKTTSGIFQKRLINIFDETQVSESTTVVLIGQAESTIFMLCTRKGVSDIQRYDSYMDYLEKGAFE